MKFFRNSKHAVAAIASFALVAAMGCTGSSEPVQDVTFLTFGPASGATLALGYSADRGVHFARINASSVVHMAKSQNEPPQETGGGGGGGFFSASTGGSSSFSGSTGGSTAFSGATDGTVGFSGAVAGPGAFSGTAILNGAGCDLSALCDLVALICESEDADCDGFSQAQCLAAVNSPQGQEAIAEAFGEDPELAAIFCVFVNFISCVYENATSIEDVSQAQAEQCAEEAGLVDLFAGQSGF